MIFGRNGIAPAINGPTEIAINPQGTCAFVTNFGGTAAQVSRYRIDQHSGVLTSLGSATAGQTPLGVAVWPHSGAAVLVVNRFGQSVSSFVTFPFDCSLHLVSTLDLFAATNSLAAAPEMVAFHPTLPNAYVTDDGLDQIYELGINTTSMLGTASLLGTITPNPSGDVQPAPFSIVAHPGGKFLYTGSSSNGIISEFNIDAAGLLTWESNISIGVPSPISLAIEPLGKYLYAANLGNSTVAMFAIDGTTGALTPIGEPNTIPAESPAKPGSGPFSIVTTN
jgi:6-phosphogluconolactonase (cycloisomerase 2 family)